MTREPGCNSELTLFYENGHFKLTKNFFLVWNDYGWDKASNLIFVYQPIIGTRFTYTYNESDIRHDEEGVSSDLYDSLQLFVGRMEREAEGYMWSKPFIKILEYAFSLSLV
ncbi:serine carboxypeptidase-like 49 [Glycine soja]|uniref:serine carboxypeptidase-like 49 n=1 Tax=Glycine soja TaxID=3848 RepID=UPI00103AE170|nr:serine carboxypeptidase-like 49 [Glycine soja]